MTYWQHETAIVDPGARIGDGTKIWHFSHVCGTEVEIGRDCSLGQNVYVGPHVKIGNGVRIQNNVSVYDLVELEDYVFCGPSAVFTNVINPRSHIPRKSEYKPTLVRRGASLGANCTIVCGIEIGQFAFVGAGSVVTKNVPAFALVVGVPARRVGWICQCGIQLKNIEISQPVRCSDCGSEYLLKPDALSALRLVGKGEKS
jgi:UDP-2-acetamido-3-amino-2,3-dideoxy-glucuronate N-acetyltransferase